jgi:hypothetical protein
MLDFTLRQLPHIPQCNFRATDWEKFNNTLNTKLSALPIIADIHTLESPADLDKYVEIITTAIQDNITNCPSLHPLPI